QSNVQFWGATAPKMADTGIRCDPELHSRNSGGLSGCFRLPLRRERRPRWAAVRGSAAFKGDLGHRTRRQRLTELFKDVPIKIMQGDAANSTFGGAWEPI